MVENPADRVTQLSAIQTSDHKTWYFNMTGCLEAIDEGASKDKVEAYLLSYWDRMAEAINALGDVEGASAHNEAVKDVSRIGQEFLSRARRDLQAVRRKL